MGKTFKFDLYRLNIVDVEDFFVASDAHRLRTDDEIIDVIQKSSSPDYDLDQETRTAIYKWSIRDFCEYPAISGLRRIAKAGVMQRLGSKAGVKRLGSQKAGVKSCILRRAIGLRSVGLEERVSKQCARRQDPVPLTLCPVPALGG